MNVAKTYSQINIFSILYLGSLFFLNLFLNEYLFYSETYLFFLILVSISTFGNINNSNTYTKLFIIILIFISLSSPTRDWDARSIWMFHAKKIFFEQNIFAQFDNYGFQNEYPIFISYYSAQLARIVGIWNDILPKLSTFLIAIPCIIFLSEQTKSKVHELVIIFLYVVFFGKALINGEADALLGLYFTSIYSLIFLSDISLSFKKKNLFNILFLIFLMSIFLNIKTNSFFLLVVLTISVLIFLNDKEKKKITFISLFLSSVPLIFFKINVMQNKLTGTFFKSFFEVDYISVLTNFSEFLVILNEIFISKYFLFTLIIFFIFVFLNKEFFLKEQKDYCKINLNEKLNSIYAGIFIYFCHILFLISVLMILSNEVYFDVVVLSLKRYTMPILFFLSYIIVHSIFNISKKTINVL